MATLDRRFIETLIFGEAGARRFTQDSPVLPDVWLRYATVEPDGPVDLLLTPHRGTTVGELARHLLERLSRERGSTGSDRPRRSAKLASNQSTVVAELSLTEMIRIALPLSSWWREHVLGGRFDAETPDFASPNSRALLVAGLNRMETARRQRRSLETSRREGGAEEWYADEEFLWMVRLVGTMILVGGERDVFRTPGAESDEVAKRHEQIVDAFCTLMAGVEPAPPSAAPHLFLVSVNRVAKPALVRSVLAVKGDAARRLFNVRCARLTWAIIDSGIDATHPAFRKRDERGHPRSSPFELHPSRSGRGNGPDGLVNNTRVSGTYDFTRVRHLMNPMDSAEEQCDELGARLEEAQDGPEAERLRGQLEFWSRLMEDPDVMEKTKRLREGLRSGRTLDWSEILPLLEVLPSDPSYTPGHDHGTHVAGILAADWRREDGDYLDSTERRRTDPTMEGVCPDINLIDLRVLDDFGMGDEFSVMAALQFVRWFNANQDAPIIHGVNLSLSIPHDVANYACGRTPVCDECERVVATGVVVVAAAGNEGYIQFQTPTGQTEGYMSISITDPGNAEGVITVGATHRYHPHTYGVSYFSGRGPTGDGRLKPDLVAPGEKILAPVPNGSQVKDGTSMAAPHVSGAAALLMSRHLELIGRPAMVKTILCDTATDLGRERYFQGAGMLDALRALQLV